MCLLHGSAVSAPFLDDFSTDSSATYFQEDSFGAGGSFEISGGTLNITTGANNTFTVTTASPVPFAVGESVGVDVPAQTGDDGMFLTLGTAAGQPGGDDIGYRWRRDSGGGGLRPASDDDGIFADVADPDKSSRATLWIDRVALDTFDFYFQLEGELSRTFVAQDQYAALSTFTDLHIGMQAFDGAATTYAFDNLRIVDTGDFLSLSLVVDRDTGGMTIQGDPNQSIPILGYSIRSEVGALDQSGWTPVRGNYDASGDGSVDANDAWTVLTAPGDHSNFSEAELVFSGGDGGAIPQDADGDGPGGTISLSDAGAWIKNPSEDLTFRVLLADGTSSDFPVEFVGNGGTAFVEADLDFNSVINGRDWLLFVENHLTDLSGLSGAEAYSRGDFDGDGDNDIADFRRFKTAFESANGPGSFSAMINSTPEPSALATLALSLGAWARVRRRPTPFC